LIIEAKEEMDIKKRARVSGLLTNLESEEAGD
jgi:hypothetical protein